MLCFSTVSPWRSSTGLGTSSAYSAAWRWPGLLGSGDDVDVLEEVVVVVVVVVVDPGEEEVV
jgi:hypothetical protein